MFSASLANLRLAAMPSAILADMHFYVHHSNLKINPLIRVILSLGEENTLLIAYKFLINSGMSPSTRWVGLLVTKVVYNWESILIIPA